MTAVVKSAQRAFAVLELFERERRPLSLTQVVGLLGYPTSSAAALLKSLIVMGYLEYDRSSRTYGPTMRIVALGQWVRDQLFGNGAVLGAAQRLHAETGLTVVLAVQSDLHAQYLHLVHSGEPLRTAVTPGQLRPLASSGMGWLLLAAQPDREVRRLVRRIRYAGLEARVDMAALLARLHEVRVRGYAFSRDGVSPGFGLIGALMPATPNGRRLAIGLAGRTGELEAREADLAARLRAAVAL
ncbi:DNA-binding IclR family transcriptional regulator [Caulobacter ginsengisoli]|uniref:DNA-binding IclR family transcriptional regulator n=1 Tax=Caulobacter ginsengisoli TaxID=400775 RepID=A0ABU0IPE9_9CAUL|nr:helix-turn-helix domain-containing protein [Caulobacter ginsengisoli]MDQ0462842.1 DNA-binding IclR family transcriptional regulator [Caulobacter ginsengisoli]